MIVAEVSLQWPEQLHSIFIKERAYFGTASLCPSHSTFDRKYGLDLIEFAPVDGGLAAFVVERVDNHFEFAVAVQIKHRGDLVFLLPSVFFSGFIFPRETMPWIFYALGALFPTTYFIALMRAIILRRANFFEYWPNLLVLIVMSNLLFSLCALRFRKKLA